MVVGPLHQFTTLAAFTTLFPDAITDMDRGSWDFDSGRSTFSSNTGPGENNGNHFGFVYTETSGSSDIAEVEANGLAIMSATEIPVQTSRTLRIRACVQGLFGDGVEGLQIQHRVGSGGSWTLAAFIHGWMFTNSYEAGDTITDENQQVLVCVADGGWVDFDVAVPDSATQVRLSPRYVVPTGQTIYTHDIAVREMQWSWPDAASAVTLTMQELTANATLTQPTLTATQTLEMQELTANATLTQPTLTALSLPDPPTGLRTVEAGFTTVNIEWTEPADTGGTPITGYEIQIDGGVWVNTRSTVTSRQIAGLTPGQPYSVSVRAVNASGHGTATTFSVSTQPAQPPSVPRFLTATATGKTTILLTWTAPLTEGSSAVTKYQVCVVDEFGVTDGFVDIAADGLVRGLAFGHRYGFKLRAVNTTGAGATTPVVYATPERPSTILVPTEAEQIPLESTARQSLIVRLNNIDCLVRVWWQPDQEGWFGSLEVPFGTPVVRGRRLVVNGGLLAGIVDVLPGDVVCRAVEDADALTDPGIDAWLTGTHGLFYEPDFTS